MDGAAAAQANGLTFIAAMLLGATRALGVLSIFPIFSLFTIVGILRIFLSIGLSAPAIAILYDTLGHSGPSVLLIGGYALKEFAVGFLLGVAFGIPFWAAQAAGDMTDVYRGANQSNTFDQINALETTALGSILLSASLAMFVASGGLLDLFDLFYRSFAFWPILSVTPTMSGDSARYFVDLFEGLFRSGALLAMPLVALLAAAELAVGFVGRSSRQFPLSDSLQTLKNLILTTALVAYVTFVPTYFKDIWSRDMTIIAALFEGRYGQNDETEEKSLPPSFMKLARLRREGSVPHSKDFPAAVSAVAVTLYLFLSMSSVFGHFAATFEAGFVTIGDPAASEPTRSILGMAQALAGVAGPCLLVALVVSVAASVFDAGGFVFSGKHMSFDLSRINPTEGLKKIFQLASLAELLKQTVKLLLIGVGGACIMLGLMGGLFWSPLCGETCSISMAGYLVGALTLVAIAVMSVAAVVDIKISRLLFNHENRMTKTEAKREHKEQFGDPHIRNARRRAAMSEPPPKPPS